ncbi:MAG TPA: hypothetical protein VFV52_00835 [Bacilli bacterium]|nr:hypothetical protein [Bacilli bacterium]
MKFQGNRNWFLIALAIGSPYYWGQYMLAKSQDATTVAISAAFAVVAVILLVFLLRKQYIEIGPDTITLQTPIRRRRWSVADIDEVSITDKWICLLDKTDRYTYLMIPQKPEQFQALREAVTRFCRHHKLKTSTQDFRQRRYNPGEGTSK